MKFQITDTPRMGDHICYISNLKKICAHFPEWNVSKSLDEIILEIYQGWVARAD
jgi:CDP-paratose 2-epimerase